MRGAVKRGTGRGANAAGIAIAGKTGTAQKSTSRGYVDKYVASFFGAFYLGFDRAAGDDADVLDQRLAMLGGVVQASYFFAGQLEVSARWSMVVVDAGLLAAARTRAVVTNLLTPGALSPHAGTLQREEERGVGFNVYLIGTSLKWQTDLTWLLAAHVDGATRHQLRLRTQLHLAF